MISVHKNLILCVLLWEDLLHSLMKYSGLYLEQYTSATKTFLEMNLIFEEYY